jgi:CheY-like chemotaxis protein
MGYDMKKRILIAEDDPDILLILNIMLSGAGYEVDSSLNGRPIIEGDFPLPDLFILDKQMPDMDGVEISRYLKEQPSTKQIPVIMISATPGFQSLAKNVGVEACLEKPFKTNDLLNLVAKYMRYAPERTNTASSNRIDA